METFLHLCLSPSSWPCNSMCHIFRDIAARNVLLTEKGDGRVAKICDFGLSRDVNNGDYCRRVPHSPVPLRWYPPEAIKNHMHATKSDVW